MIIYGTDLCKDCVQCKQELDRAGICYEYRDITANLQFLKEFLKIRDSSPLYDTARVEASIGIPTIVANERITLDWTEFM